MGSSGILHSANDDQIDAPRETLGHVQLRHATTNEIVLIPAPSNNPNDPLNWPLAERSYIFMCCCFGIFVCQVCGPGPAAAVIEMTASFYAPPTDPNFFTYVGKIAYLITGFSLMIGVGQFIWTPVAIKYGRRPVYIICFTLLTVCNIRSAVAKSYGSEFAARLIGGMAAGAPELVAPLTVTDLFFLHQRGRVMAIYNLALGLGSGFGVIIFGLVLRTQHWRVIFWMCRATR